MVQLSSSRIHYFPKLHLLHQVGRIQSKSSFLQNQNIQFLKFHSVLGKKLYRYLGKNKLLVIYCSENILKICIKKVVFKARVNKKIHISRILKVDYISVFRTQPNIYYTTFFCQSNEHCLTFNYFRIKLYHTCSIIS